MPAGVRRLRRPAPSEPQDLPPAPRLVSVPPSTPSRARSWPCALSSRLELLDECLDDPAKIDGSSMRRCRVEPGEVEELACELREAVDLLAHALEELLLRRLVEVLVHQ